MSDQFQVSPLLDGFTVGVPMQPHSGVCSYPALKSDSEQRYIVKKIMFPPSQAQLDALLITGAYRDPAAAADFFRELAEDAGKEADFLEKISQQGGFLPFDGWQIVPQNHNRLGYELFLLSSYRLSLAKYMHRHPITHLEAVNLGLDMCSALTLCRKAGKMYVNLKPANIYVSSKKTYKIGDLGFVSTASMAFQSLPARYSSAYSAPELRDDLNAMNLTADTYSLGMLLYQIFNNGKLPEDPMQMPPPVNGNLQINAIIMKACDPDPAKRWDNPEEMGNALVAYMQTESINNTQIMAPLPAVKKAVKSADKAAEEKKSLMEDATKVIPVIEEASAAAATEAAMSNQTISMAAFHQIDTSEPEGEVPAGSMPNLITENEDADESAGQDENLPVETDPEDPEEAEWQNISVKAAAKEEPSQESEAVQKQEPAEIIDPLSAISYWEDEPSDKKEPVEADPLSELLSEFTGLQDLQDADVVPQENPAESAAEAEEISSGSDLDDSRTNEDEAEDGEEETDPGEPSADDLEEWDDFDDSEESEYEEDYADVHDLLSTPAPSPVLEAPKKQLPEKKSKKKKKARKRTAQKVLITILVLVMLGTAAVGGYVFYDQYYIRNVQSMQISGSQYEMVVDVVSDVEEGYLTAVCVDAYGAAVRQTVVNGQAVFHDLKPDSLYKVSLEVSGLHKLNGTTSDIFTTEALTNIVSLQAITGADNGSAFVSMTVEGHEAEQWMLYYSAEDEPENFTVFSGHTTTVTGLTVGKTYRFRLEAEDESPLMGETSISFQASDVVLAKDLSIISVENGVMTIHWDTPENAQISSWKVRCYGDNYDETKTVSETQAQFSNISTASAYTVEVTASDNTQAERVSITANPITLTDFQVSDDDKKVLNLTWEIDGDAPSGGWLLQYTVDGSVPSFVKCGENKAVISPRIPDAEYAFTLMAADGTSVFDGVRSFTSPSGELFVGHAISGYQIKTTILATPSRVDWNYSNASMSEFAEPILAGGSISAVLKVGTRFYLDDEDVALLFVIRDENGKVLPELTVSRTQNWEHMWDKEDYHFASMNVGKAPSQPGKYMLDIYFDGQPVNSTSFTVS